MQNKLSSYTKVWFLVNLITIGSLITFHLEFWCSLIFIVWLNILLYSMQNMGNRCMLFAFNIAFFFFLLGRELLEQFFLYEVEEYPRGIVEHTDQLLLISLICYSFSYIFFSKIRKKRLNDNIYQANDMRYVGKIRKLSLLLFWITLIGATVYAIIIAIFVQSVGYVESYMADNNAFFRESLILRMLNRCEMMLPIALCVFLATIPPKKICNIVSSFYCIYLGITLFGGSRGDCILGLLLLFIYYFFRNKYGIKVSEVWIKKSWIVITIFMVPFLLIGLTAMNDIRKGEEVSFNNAAEGLTNFVYQQGVSVIVIKRSYQYSKQLESDSYYSLPFFHEGIFSVLRNEEYPSGNNPDRANAKHWLAHTLPYFLWPKTYLLGAGTGSSYIAELYQDFGVIGVILGNILYGFLLSQISFFSRSKIFSSSIKLIIITELLWAPRGVFTGFISIFVQASTLFSLAFIFIGTQLWSKKTLKYIISH